ncbi:hypothetical protein HW555_010183 [Spodoptera exigua]|uniref:Uncharacterized protein n=1 Tax=Spodoptera exigua TaxID=7107 RepID=A0A835GBM4_SPOEX|nr:hypothetical protein HW555_010183 [Spodoptera exigua]
MRQSTLSLMKHCSNTQDMIDHSNIDELLGWFSYLICQEREIDCKSKNSWSRPHWEQNLHFVGDLTRLIVDILG